MNTQVNAQNKEAAVAVIGEATKGAVHIVTSLLSCILEAVIEDGKEQGRKLREQQRNELLRMIARRNKIKLYNLQMMVKMRDLPLASIAHEFDIPESELKSIVKPWWYLF